MEAMLLCIIFGTSISTILAQDQQLNKNSKDIPPEYCKEKCAAGAPFCQFAIDDCRFYGRCWVSEQSWRGYVMECNYGFFFDAVKGRCVTIVNTNCTNDPCKNGTPYPNHNLYGYHRCGAKWTCEGNQSKEDCCLQKNQLYINGNCVEAKDDSCSSYCTLSDKERCKDKDGLKFKKTTHCGEYYTCNKQSPGNPTKSCCAMNNTFDPDSQKCVPDDTCTDPCGLEALKKQCKKEKIDNYTYKENGMNKSCRAYTILKENEYQCYDCVPDPNNPRVTCMQTAFLNFNTSAKEHDLKNWAENTWVGSKNLSPTGRGYIEYPKNLTKPAYFSIPSYKDNTAIWKEIYLEVNFTPADGISGQNSILVSNCQVSPTDYSPSFNIELSPNSKMIMVMAKSAEQNATVEVRYEPGSENFMTVDYNGTALTVTNTPTGEQIREMSAPLTGVLTTPSSALMAGACQNNNKKKQYYGKINEFKLWKCKN